MADGRAGQIDAMGRKGSEGGRGWKFEGRGRVAGRGKVHIRGKPGKKGKREGKGRRGRRSEKEKGAKAVSGALGKGKAIFNKVRGGHVLRFQ
jgi:hypothetical protein